MEQGQANETTKAAISDTAGALAEATKAMAETLYKINAQFDGLHAKIDRIVAAVEEDEAAAGDKGESVQQRLADAEKKNQDLKAQAARAQRKTLSPMVTRLLAKEGTDSDALIETPLLEKALSGLSVEQRIAVKAELARAGLLV